ncbi:MAG: hypothetical protein DRP78_02115 [Candidatus Omnitrophota bacterium]|nr:MAG: hypothetical protein DRP78_02115 [Candidatus Omnitrophota bacterium]
MFVLFLGVGILGFGGSARAEVDLPWFTTYDCADWNQYSDPLVCDGLSKAGGWICDPGGLYEQITVDANYSGGAGGKGQRHWLGDGKNQNSGGTQVTFNTPQTEIWVRFYVRFQQGFEWGTYKGYKMLYFDSTNEGTWSPFYLPLYSDSISIYTGKGSAEHVGCSGCSWTTYSMSDGNWNCVEIHIKSETISNNDGVLEIWINGNRVANHTDVNFGLISVSDTLSGVLIGSNADSPLNGQCAYVDYDDIAISNTGYIGPISASDTTTPFRSNPQPAGTLTSGTTSITISLDTDETATCKYGTLASVLYDDILNTFSSTNSTTHSQTITGLSDGETKTYYVRCQDELNNANTDDFEISFSVANASSDTTPPVRSNAFPQGELDADTIFQDISLTTDEDATCRYSPIQGASYANMTNFSATTGTNHTTEVTGLENGLTYNYYVKCKDELDNTNPDDFAITFSVAGTQGTNNNTSTSSGGSGSCFIATAAYGTLMAEQVKILSRFRDNHLLTNYCGKIFVNLYYKYSPKMADYIRHSDWARSVVRLMLSPLVNLIR